MFNFDFLLAFELPEIVWNFIFGDLRCQSLAYFLHDFQHVHVYISERNIFDMERKRFMKEEDTNALILKYF